jgi:hypothetical protein
VVALVVVYSPELSFESLSIDLIVCAYVDDLASNA